MGLAQTARDRQRATIGGRANPFQNDDPLGKAFADSIEKGAGDAVKGVMDWWERSSADQEGIGDDLLRLVAGGVKNTTKAWQDATAEQEGITDDILRGVGWTAGKGMQVLDAGSYYGGQIGGKLASAVGVDARIGGAAGNIIGDVLAGGAVAKGTKIASRSAKLALMSPVQRSLSAGTVGAMKAPPTKIRQYIGIATREAFEPELKAIQKGMDVLEEGAENIRSQSYNMLRSTSTPVAAKSRAVRTIDFQALPQAQRRTEIGKYFDEMYTEGMTEAQKYTYLEAANFGGQATEKGQKFVKSVAGTHRNIFGGSAHHFGLDLGLSGATLNRSDAPEILKILNSVDVFPGNHPKNYIMAYHDYTKQIVDAQKAALIKSGMKPKAADAFLKNIPEGKMLSKAELADLNTWETLDEIQKLKKIQGRNWGKTNVDPKKLDLPKALIGTDHQEFIHGIGDKLPKRLKLIELSKTDKWLELSPQQAARKIAEVVREQQNVALNVNKWRLDKIKKAMKFDPAKHDWTDIQAWMIQDPRRAAHLDWYKTGAEGIGMSVEKITSDLPPNVAKEVAQVFNLEQVPRTNAKLRAFLSKTALEQKLN